MTSSCIKLKILLLSPSETEKANLINLLHFWSRDEDIIACLQQRKGIVKSKYLEIDTNEESKLEAQKQQSLIKTYNFNIEDAENNKRFEIKLIDDTKQFKEGDTNGIQAILAKKSDMDGVLLALKGTEFEDIFQTSKDFEDSKKRNPQLTTLINRKESDLKFIESLKDIFSYRNEIFDVDPEVFLNDSGKQKEFKEMNQKAREVFFEIFRKLWANVAIFS